MRVLEIGFINSYPDQPEHMTELGKFVFYRTYSRWLPDDKRRETYKEMVTRSTRYNVELERKHKEKHNIPFSEDELQKEYDLLSGNMFNLDQFLSGRTAWVGGSKEGVAEKYPLSNFNCSFLNIESWSDLGDLFYLLLVGTGVGLKCTKEMARNIAPIRTDIKLIHSEYDPLPKEQRLERSTLKVLENGYAKLYVGDSKEGWVDSLRILFDVLSSTDGEVHTLKISYNSIRPKGEKLRTFGGSASGHESLRDMFIGIDQVIHNEIDTNLDPLEPAYAMSPDGTIGFDMVETDHYHVRPVHIFDMANLVGNNVVVGGVRRTAEICLGDADDWEFILMKYGINGIWDEEKHKQIIDKVYSVTGKIPNWLIDLPIKDANARPLHHRRMSNNSIAFTEKPDRDFLHLVFALMQGEGEPGFVNLRGLAIRRFKGLGITSPTEEMLQEMMYHIGMNPCAEIALWKYGVCNLTTLNMMRFVIQNPNGSYDLDIDRLIEAQELSARAGLRMTLVELELPHWNKVQERDRLLGCSLTGWQDAMELVGYNKIERKFLLTELNTTARDEADRYAKELRVTAPLLVSTVKPEGTISQVFGGVSSGVHFAHSPYFIRRIRINSSDPLALAVRTLGWRIFPDTGSKGETYEEKMSNAGTWVIEFPNKSGAKRTKDDITTREQFDTYFSFQRHYTEHNASNTITVKPDEWEEAEQIVWDNWDEFCAVSFLAHDGGSYELAPYEAISEAEYHLRADEMAKRPFTLELLQTYETGNLDEADIGEQNCIGGACGIR